jgi:hypothetical protein
MVAVRVLREGKLIPRVIALMKMKKDNMKMINDARPKKLISFLETRWPIIAAKNARLVKKRAEQKVILPILRFVQKLKFHSHKLLYFRFAPQI